MNIKEINAKLIEAAKAYKNNLLNHNMLIIYSEAGKISAYETVYLGRSFKHLTGIKSSVKASDFFKRCTKEIISPKDYNLAKDGTTELKLDVIMQAMNLEKTARAIGDYNRSGINLSSDIIVGNIRYSLGFVPDENNPQYLVPNTLLKEDVRKLTINPTGVIIGMVKKPIKGKLYSDVVYLSSKIDWKKAKIPTDILSRLSPEAQQCFTTGILTAKTTAAPSVTVVEETHRTASITKLQQENKKLKEENSALKSENAAIKAISDRRATAIHTANAVLKANPELKKNFVAEKQKLTQATKHKQHNKPQSPQKGHKH